ncbi:MAG TPA: hydrogenase-4 subunit B [Gammaproteobacteria bacterium]|nr:hydrogenase-4 subunit B [Gammaproteobacteria bacterium]
MQSAGVVLATAGLSLAAAVAGAAVGTRRGGTAIVYAVSLAACTIALAAALAHLLGSAEPSAVTLPLGLPWIGAHFRVDALSAFFLVVVNLGGAAASLYALGYGRHEESPGRVLPFFPAFLAGMNLVVLADDAFAFLVSWEFMSLVSWALVISHHREHENVRAGYIYLVMASFGTLALLLAFGLLAGPGGAYDFASMRAAEPTALVGSLALALVLLGAGSKAGLVPLHVWLPLAHPAAPSHVSALMSGVMTKIAIYAFVRVAFDLIGAPAWWQGMTVLSLGASSAVLGVLYALMQRDLKRLLAYSTIENVGIVFLGLGLALAFRADGLGAGAALNATGLRDIERLGGLIRRMPYTSFAFLVGCVAITGLPPLNGFASEWLTFQAILQSPDLPQWALKFSVPAAGGMLALSAALAAACFVKAFGVSFLGRPRSGAAETAREVDRFSLAAMLALAALCVGAGLVPGVILDALSPVSLSLVAERMPVQATQPWLSVIPIAEARSSYNGLLVFAFVAASAGLAALAIHRFASRAVRRAPAWDCGFPQPSPITQYTGASFSQPIRRVFGSVVFRARERVEIPPPGDPRPARIAVQLRDLVWEGLYEPIAAGVGFAAQKLNKLQFLTIRRYLSLVFVALVSLLVVLALWV